METPVSLTHMVSLDAAALRGWPLPMPADGTDQKARGHVLVLGGAHAMPDALILAATAALRAGAARLTIATGASVAQLVAQAIPEARVIGLDETDGGAFAPASVGALDPLADKVSTVLIGPGMHGQAASAAPLRALLARLDGVAVVLDACAMDILLNAEAAAGSLRFAHPVIVTARAADMAQLSGASDAQIGAEAALQAAGAARHLNAVVALQGARTIIAAPDGGMWQHDGGAVGLAPSGSGDVLSGIIAGLAARGAPLAQAACWGVALHAQAGQRLAARVGPPGYLARELIDEIPALLDDAKAP